MRTGDAEGYRFAADQVYTLPNCKSGSDLQYHLAVVLAFLQQLVGFYGALKREDLADDWCQLALRDPLRELVPRGLHDLALLRKVGQPQSLKAGGLRIKRPHIELRLLAGCGAVLDDASEIAQAAQAFRGVLATQHFEDRVHAFTVGEVLHNFFVVVLFVVDAVLQAKVLYPRQFFVRRGGPIHFNAENAADLYCRGAHASSHGVNQHARVAPWCGWLRHARLPVSEIRSEVVDGEGCGLLVRPAIGNGPQHVGVGADFLGECSPLDITHHAPAGIFFSTGELAASDQRRRRRSGIATLRGHEVGEIQPASPDTD